MIVGEFRPMLAGTRPDAWGPFVDVDLSLTAGSPIIIAKLNALVDTGGAASFIDSALAVRLGLRQIGTAPQMIMGKIEPSPLYRAALTFMTGLEVETTLAASTFRSGGSTVDILLGMPILSNFHLQISRRRGRVRLQPASAKDGRP